MAQCSLATSMHVMYHTIDFIMAYTYSITPTYINLVSKLTKFTNFYELATHNFRLKLTTPILIDREKANDAQVMILRRCACMYVQDVFHKSCLVTL